MERLLATSVENWPLYRTRVSGALGEDCEQRNHQQDPCYDDDKRGSEIAVRRRSKVIHGMITQTKEEGLGHHRG